jgi:hypothetical protein
MDDIQLTPEQEHVLNDLRVQALMFDMDIDFESASLVKTQPVAPKWLTRYKERQYELDNDPASAEQADWDDIR